MKIIITGGAGYIGCVLSEQLLSLGHTVICFDNFSFGNTPIKKMTSNKNFHPVVGNITEVDKFELLFNSCDAVIHLAGIVGYPQCKKEPELAQKVNVDGSKLLISVVDPSIPIIFSSTVSVYGNSNNICYEDSTTNPLTLYSQNKIEGENLFRFRGNSVIFRLATVYGISSKMRSDLLLNNFVKQAIETGKLEVYEKNYKRTFINVKDAAGAFVFALNNFDHIKEETYNVGSNDLNYSKEDICNIIKSKIPVDIVYNEFDRDDDQRNYIVNYDKLNATGYIIKNNIEKDIEDLIIYYKS